MRLKRIPSIFYLIILFMIFLGLLMRIEEYQVIATDVFGTIFFLGITSCALVVQILAMRQKLESPNKNGKRNKRY